MTQQDEQQMHEDDSSSCNNAVHKFYVHISLALQVTVRQFLDPSFVPLNAPQVGLAQLGLCQMACALKYSMIAAARPVPPIIQLPPPTACSAAVGSSCSLLPP